MAFLIKKFSHLFDKNIDDFNTVGKGEMVIPKFSEEILLRICQEVTPVLNQDPVLLNLTGNYVVVGDLHGNIRDLLRIFSTLGTPYERKYLFLGDYVDRGEFSVEVVTLLFAFKIVVPNNIFLLRGNHEFEDINSIYGFKDQVEKSYTPFLFKMFNKCFSYLPLAATINKTTFLVHGGISPLLNRVELIKDIPKPMMTYKCTKYENLVDDLVWSDPSTDCKFYNPSLRGTGILFGYVSYAGFVKRNSLERVIRAHQCVFNGIAVVFNNLYTVFSSSAYAPKVPNKCGVIEIDENEMKTYTFEPLDPLIYDNAVFKMYRMSRASSSTLVSKIQSDKTVIDNCLITRPTLALMKNYTQRVSSQKIVNIHGSII